MPTYQYACTSCGEDLEVVQKFTDDPLTVCPKCSGALRKVFTPVGVVFKGSGFYKTDSRTTSGSSAKPAETKTGEDTSTPAKSTHSAGSDSSSAAPAAAATPSAKPASSSGTGDRVA
jgi:putative FmdB family regulatory protein